MHNRLEPILRIICLTLGALLIWQAVRVVLRGDPLGHSTIPSLPTLALATSPAKKPASAPASFPGRPIFPGRPPDGVQAQPMPPLIQARLDRIQQSEILGPFMRPIPMALLGIAGDDAFLRAPDGQSGMLKEGGELGGIKLLRIGINRVMVEENGEKKELTVFSGMGGESLLPKEKESSTNTVRGPKPKEKL